VDEKLDMTRQVCAGSPEGHPCPGLHPQQHGQQGEGGDSAPLPQSGDTPPTPPEVLRPALEPSAQDRPGAAGAGPEEATKMVRGLEHLCCEERLRRVGAAQHGEEKAPGRAYCGLSVLIWSYKKDGDRLFSRLCCDRTN